MMSTYGPPTITFPYAQHLIQLNSVTRQDLGLRAQNASDLLEVHPFQNPTTHALPGVDPNFHLTRRSAKCCT